MRDCPLPIVAGVNGVAAGAGSVLALASDFRLLARSATFAFLFSGSGSPARTWAPRTSCPASSARGEALELLILGDEVTAERALEIGLATKVVDDDELPAATEALARRLADGPALAYSTTKVLLTRELDLDLAGAIELEALGQALMMQSEDHREFYAAWSEGRRPSWTGQ